MLIRFFICAGLIGFTSCADTEFSGENGRKRGDDAVATEGNNDPDGVNPGGPGADGSNGGTNGFGNGSGNGGGNGGDDFGFDLEWGGFFRSWHIGNDDHEATTCKIRVFTNILDSNFAANFYFTVHEDNTTLDIVPMHCGSEGQSSGFNGLLQVLDANTNQVVNGLQTQMGSSKNFALMSKQPFRGVRLNRGQYKIRIATSQRQSDGDWDDIIVRAKIENNSRPITVDREVKTN